MEEILDPLGSGNVIIVDNLPSVPSETYKRLEDVLINKIFCLFWCHHSFFDAKG